MAEVVVGLKTFRDILRKLKRSRSRYTRSNARAAAAHLHVAAVETLHGLKQSEKITAEEEKNYISQSWRILKPYLPHSLYSEVKFGKGANKES